MKCFGYTVISCEMGSEGYSSWSDFNIYEGETKEDVVRDYLKKVHAPNLNIGGRIIENPDKHEFIYNDYFTTHFIILPDHDIYGHAREIDISFPVMLHDDSPLYDKEKGGRQIKDYYEILKEYADMKKENNKG